MNSNHRSMFVSGGRYPILRSIAIIYLILGVVSIIGGILGVIWMLGMAPYTMGDRVILAAATAVGTVFTCALMLGAAEVIKLFVDIEHNARVTPSRRPLTPFGVMDMEETVERDSSLEEETAEFALIRGH
jgi:hypothetical protein